NTIYFQCMSTRNEIKYSQIQSFPQKRNKYNEKFLLESKLILIEDKSERSKKKKIHNQNYQIEYLSYKSHKITEAKQSQDNFKNTNVSLTSRHCHTAHETQQP
ncbi:hypothetical protein XENOCAPTIV_017020, partial [Xenoophorus captivus]